MKNKISRALVSVSDKTGLIPFCRFLTEMSIEIISTGGTARALLEANIPLVKISDHTGSPEILDGRVKTLHPKVHGGILGLRDMESHVETMLEQNIPAIDLVVVNLYPFERVSSEPGRSFEEVIENIDIGGPSMIRSAAKNFRFVGVVTAPSQYEEVMSNLKSNEGALSLGIKRSLAEKAFELTSHYDEIITAYLKRERRERNEKQGKSESSAFPDRLSFKAEKVMDLRYGENPHQKAAFYRCKEGGKQGKEAFSLPSAKQHQGKELSFNNILDFDGALSCVKEFWEEPAACVIVKHTNPCGVAIGSHSLEAFEKAWAGDSLSAFGSVIAFNREVDGPTASTMADYFIEGIIAPSFSEEARTIFSKKKNLRLLEIASEEISSEGQGGSQISKISFDFDMKKVSGGVLLQTRDLSMEGPDDFMIPTDRKPEEEEVTDLFFSWKVVKHVKSNAIVFAKNRLTLGIGAGQMSRVDSVKIGAIKCSEKEGNVVLASDAFFPFRDAIDSAKKAGVTAIIQPGGSKRDQEVVDACNEHGIAMVFTKVRHFRH